MFWWFRPEWWWRWYGTRYILKMWPTGFTEVSMDRVRGRERSRKTPRFMALVRVAIDWHWTSVGRTVGKGKIRGSVLDTLYLQCQGGMDLELGVGYSWEKEPRLQWYIWEFVNISMAERLNEMTKRVPLNNKEVSKPCLREHSRVKFMEMIISHQRMLRRKMWRRITRSSWYSEPCEKKKNKPFSRREILDQCQLLWIG